jgi:hypothetical protein
MAGLMTAAGVGGVVWGVECLAGPGAVAIPFESMPFVFAGAPGVELGTSLRRNASLVAAVLVDTRMLEIPRASFAESDSLALVALPGECGVLCESSFHCCGALTGIDLENVEVLHNWCFYGCNSLSHIGAHFRLRNIGIGAFQGVAVSGFELESVALIDGTAFAGGGLREFSGRVGEWGPRPFANCRDLQRLEMWPGRGFDPLELVGHVPRDIRFHAHLGKARRIFRNLLHGSRTRVVVTADSGHIAGGPGSSIARRTKRDRILVTWPDYWERKDISIWAVDLSGLPAGGLSSTMKGFICVEAVTLPAWLEGLPDTFFRKCRSLRAVNLEECRGLRKIGFRCFQGCVSLRDLSFPDDLLTVGGEAFAGSGLETFKFTHAKDLAQMSASGAHWLASVRLPLRLHAWCRWGGAYRIVDMSGGLWDVSNLRGRLRRFRSSAMRCLSCQASCCLASAWVTAELVATGGRSGVPALPC